MESKFNILAAQKRGMASTSHTVDYLVNGLVAAVLIGALAGTIFGYFGTGANGLGNRTLNPDTPTWLPSVMLIIAAVGVLYLFLRAMGVTKK